MSYSYQLIYQLELDIFNSEAGPYCTVPAQKAPIPTLTLRMAKEVHDRLPSPRPRTGSAISRSDAHYDYHGDDEPERQYA